MRCAGYQSSTKFLRTVHCALRYISEKMLLHAVHLWFAQMPRDHMRLGPKQGLFETWTCDIVMWEKCFGPF